MRKMMISLLGAATLLIIALPHTAQAKPFGLRLARVPAKWVTVKEKSPRNFAPRNTASLMRAVAANALSAAFGLNPFGVVPSMKVTSVRGDGTVKHPFVGKFNFRAREQVVRAIRLKDGSFKLESLALRAPGLPPTLIVPKKERRSTKKARRP